MSTKTSVAPHAVIAESVGTTILAKVITSSPNNIKK